MDNNLYNYKATLKRVIDGDTIEVNIDLGFDVSINTIIRIKGVDAPETRTKRLIEKEAGLHVAKQLEEFLGDNVLYLKTYKNDKYGRYLADVFVFVYDEIYSVAEEFIAYGRYHVYDGGKKQEWTDSELLRIKG